MRWEIVGGGNRRGRERREGLKEKVKYKGAQTQSNKTNAQKRRNVPLPPRLLLFSGVYANVDSLEERGKGDSPVDLRNPGWAPPRTSGLPALPCLMIQKAAAGGGGGEGGGRVVMMVKRGVRMVVTRGNVVMVVESGLWW